MLFLSLRFFREASGGRLNEVNENIRVDGLYGFQRVTDTKDRTGFLINMHAVSSEMIVNCYLSYFCTTADICIILFYRQKLWRTIKDCRVAWTTIS